jgi:hypothetical protein
VEREAHRGSGCDLASAACESGPGFSSSSASFTDTRLLLWQAILWEPSSVASPTTNMHLLEAQINASLKASVGTGGKMDEGES